MGRRAGMLGLALAAVIGATSAAAAEGPKPLFASSDMIHVSIRGPIASLTQGSANKSKSVRSADETKSVTGSLSVQGAAPETLAITLSPRGITRRRKDVCTFPPLKVEFAEKPAATSLFKGQKGLKLVTHCRATETFQQYLLLEYAAYRMYNLLTPASFNVRLATIDYADENGRPTTSRLGFFIEDADDMARRNGLEEIETTERVPVERLSPPDASRFIVFQNFIGNLDFAMTAGPAGDKCCHNAKLIAAKGASSGLIPVPYDFDFAGMVDAPYAAPPAEFPLPNVRIRRYRGYCRHNAEAVAFAAELRARRAALLGVLDQIPQLEPKSRDKARSYLDGYFEQIATPDDVAKLQEKCMGPGAAS